MSGSFAGHLHIWNVHDGTLVKSYQGILPHMCMYCSIGFGLRTIMQAVVWIKCSPPPHLFTPFQSISGVGDIFEVSWNDAEDRVAACFSTNVVAVIDLRM